MEECCLNEFVDRLLPSPPAILKATKAKLLGLLEHADSVTGRQVEAAMLHDPLAAVRALSVGVETIASRQQPKQSQVHELETITRVAIFCGFESVLSKVSAVPTVEDVLGSRPEARLGLLRVASRSHKAMTYAYRWALLRQDLGAEEVALAALIRDSVEVALWLVAPDDMCRYARRQKECRGIRSSVIQVDLFGCTFAEVQRQLAESWALPGLLKSMLFQQETPSSRGAIVALACSLARHAANGWSDAGLPADYQALEELLHLNKYEALRKLGVLESALDGMSIADKQEQDK